ncbi:unnamed protein product [Penicillium salamii]|nr:unnamed protein product [Penicillium salamii]
MLASLDASWSKLRDYYKETDKMRGYIYVVYVIDSESFSFWKENESRFLAIASLVWDYLAIPAIGVGVERLFNIARDICHYRRGSLKSGIIEELMLYLCISKFDFDVQEAEELK